MRRDPKPTPELRAAWSLHQARLYRHHKYCHCRVYHGQGCNAADALHTGEMDRQLEQLSR